MKKLIILAFVVGTLTSFAEPCPNEVGVQASFKALDQGADLIKECYNQLNAQEKIAFLRSPEIASFVKEFGDLFDEKRYFDASAEKSQSEECLTYYMMNMAFCSAIYSDPQNPEYIDCIEIAFILWLDCVRFGT